MGFFCASGDVNGDGIPDVVVPDRFIAASLSLGRAGRNYPSPVSINPSILGDAVGDVNGDGLNDILVSPGSDSGQGVVYVNKGNGVFSPGGSAPGRGIYLKDLNGDGFADLIGVDGTNLLIWPGTGDVNFTGSPITIPTTIGISPLLFADMDGDGKLDIVALGLVFYNRGNFNFQPVPVNFAGLFVVGDFNGDGHMDIAATGQTLLGSASGTFTSVPNNLNLFINYFSYPVVGDFNGDGILDVAYAPDRYVEIAYGRGDGTFYLGTALTGIDVVGQLGAGDFNGDGKTDLVAGLLLSQQLVVYTNEGNGRFQRSAVASGVATYGMAIADFNADKKPDLLLVNYALDFRPLNMVILYDK
jgi:hypothetical protein